ncbi:Pkinase-domain-containing protein [Choiromyces venosus 120613-1]|uniref:Pkinase-domain-containing protein n=1 Tax=Choiromyces venosus 120613-1 TaxID=1336337 RepID=A0A3N4J5X3_9PEZI|nr:Pkinase-domain-containing protein [Choiromyces venosus 120613-1]
MADIFTFDHDPISSPHELDSPTLTKPVYGFGGGRRRASITAAANVEGAGSVSSLAVAVAAAKISQGLPGGLAALFPHSEVSSRAPSDAGDIESERAQGKNGAGRKKKRSKSKKKKGGAGTIQQQQQQQGKKKADAKKGESVVPVDDGLSPDWNFVKRNVSPSPSSSRSSSPPRRSGLSSLLSQAHPGDLVSVRSGSDTSVESENGDAPADMGTYEIALDEDYIDEGVNSRPTSRGGPDEMRKMHAEDFETLKCLGKGTYGTVFLVRHKATGKLYAQKQFKKASLVVHKKMVEQTKTERAILESVRHPFVVKLYYAFQDKEKLYLILEYAQGGELFLHLALSTFFPETTAVFYIAELVLALSHLHQNVGVVYRDLKPENCLLDAEGHLLLTDFGLSKVKTDDSRCRSFLGTPEYMAPEILSGDGKREYGAEVDWWGVGALAVDLMTGGPPFSGNNTAKITHKIINSKLSLPYFLSPDAKDLITRLLRKDPTKRLGYNMPKDLTTIKNHRFFRKIDWAKLERREIEPPIRPLITDPELAENFSTDFTGLGLSPPVMIGSRCGEYGDEEGLFGGFSFVASRSLLGERY